MARAVQVAVRMTRAVLVGAEVTAVSREKVVFASLDSAIGGFIERLRRAPMSNESSARLAELLRIQRYHETCAEQAQLAAELKPLKDDDTILAGADRAFAEAADALLARGDSTLPRPDLDVLGPAMRSMGLRYEDLKAALLASGAAGRLGLSEMEQALRRYSALRRATQQAVKAQGRFHP